MKVNFNREHYNKLCGLAVKMLMSNGTISTKMGQPLNIVELIHTTSINGLNSIKAALAQKIQNLESRDEWVEVDTTELDNLKEAKELVNLIVGYKRWRLEAAEIAKKKAELTEKVAKLEESQKTPADLIKEAKDELAALNEVEDFN